MTAPFLFLHSMSYRLLIALLNSSHLAGNDTFGFADTLIFHHEDLAIQVRVPDALDRKYGNGRNALSIMSTLQPMSKNSRILLV